MLKRVSWVTGLSLAMGAGVSDLAATGCDLKNGFEFYFVSILAGCNQVRFWGGRGASASVSTFGHLTGPVKWAVVA